MSQSRSRLKIIVELHSQCNSDRCGVRSTNIVALYHESGMKLPLVLLCLCSLTVARNPERILRKRHLGSRSKSQRYQRCVIYHFFTDDCRQLRVEILVSPIVAKREIRALELQWEFAPNQPGDWIGLFGTDPLANRPKLPEVLWAVGVVQEHGWTKTPVLEEHSEPADLGYRVGCWLIKVDLT